MPEMRTPMSRPGLTRPSAGRSIALALRWMAGSDAALAPVAWLMAVHP